MCMARTVITGSMKHGIVLYNANVSPFVVGVLGVRDERVGPAIDCSSREMLDRIFRGSEKRLATPDGIQLYHFKNKFPAANPGHFIGPEHLEYWEQELTKRLQKRREKLDFILIPEPNAEGPLAYKHMMHWLKTIKEQWPDIQIIVYRPALDSGYDRIIRFEPIEPPKIGPTPTLEGHHISPYIDQIYYGEDDPIEHALRNYLGMETYKSQPQRG